MKYKREVAYTSLGHVLFQKCSAWLDRMSSLEVMWAKVHNPEQVCKRLFSEEEDLSHVKCRYRIIGRLISIEVLWESSHPNTLIEYGLWILFIIFWGPCHHSHTLLGLCFYESGCLLPIFYLWSWHSFAEPSIIPKPFLTCTYVKSDCLG